MRSEGLLQLAYADHQRYGCKFNWQVDRALKLHDPAKTILQPKNNLECGVKILFNQTIVQHKPLLSRSGYWSTLRPGGPSYLVICQANDKSPCCMWFVHQVGDREVGHDKVRAGRREPG